MKANWKLIFLLSLLVLGVILYFNNQTVHEELIKLFHDSRAGWAATGGMLLVILLNKK